MKIGILGSGNVGCALAKGFAAEGHVVFLATRDLNSQKSAALKASFPQVTICDFATTATEAELAVLCTPWPTAQDALKLARAEENLNGKVLVDTNNPIEREADTVHIAAGWEGSAGQMVQGWLPDTQVVKCWNSTGADNFYKPQFDAIPTMFIAGDNTDAKQQVGDLVRAFGWEPFDTGPIERSRECEALAVLWINNAMSNAGGHHAFKML